MEKTTFECQFTLFGKKVQMFHAGDMGIVIEKEPDVICVYATDAENSHILCAVPLGSPKSLNGATYRIAFFGDGVATVSVGSGISTSISARRSSPGTSPFRRSVRRTGGRTSPCLGRANTQSASNRR